MNTRKLLPRRLLQACAVLAAAMLAGRASAQLTPDRLYYGVNRAMPMTVAVPDGAQGQAEIVVLEPVSAREVERQAVKPGPVDFAALFPAVWERDKPRVLYAQLLVGGARIGPAVVLDPLLTPLDAELSGLRPAILNAYDRGDRRALSALLDIRSRARALVGFDVVFNKRVDTPVYSGIRAYTDRHVVVDTELGEMEFRLRPDEAPNTVFNFIHLVEGGFYTDTTVHRVVANRGDGIPFVVQFGDPTGAGQGGPGYMIDLEPSFLPHDWGVLSMARALEPDTAGSQVFIGLSREAAKDLDRSHAAFGQLVRGSSVLQEIMLVNTRTDAPETPENPPRIRAVRTIPAPPYGEGPQPEKAPDPDAKR